jgi:threonine dehydrogenase-like Zn-dependent dehydrogenase
LPPTLDCEHGALLEPLSVALYAVERSGMRPGDNILITGAGTIGLLTLLAARNAGANRITVTDVSDSRLKVREREAKCSLILTKLR